MSRMGCGPLVSKHGGYYMKIEKLFQVLVMGGALLSTAGIADQVTPACGVDPLPQVQSGPADELTPIFCTEPEACVVGCDGKKHVKEGFECCWGTSCDDT